MESLPELEINAAAHDRPKPKWKRPVFWSALVLLVAANLYFIALFLLPRWAPEFTVKYIRHPKAMVRAVAAQLENRTFTAAERSVGKFGLAWFTPNAGPSQLTFTSAAQECLRDLFLHGDKWEKLAVLKISASLACPSSPDCLAVFSAEMSKLDPESKVLALRAMGKMRTVDALPALENQLADSNEEVQITAMTAITQIGYAVAGNEDRVRVLELLRGVLRKETDDSVKEPAAIQISMLRTLYWKELPLVSPDEELKSLLRSEFEYVRSLISSSLVAEQFRNRLDAAWYPLLNEVFKKESTDEVRGNAALMLILAGDPQSDEKLKFIESLCDPKQAPLPLTKGKIEKELAELPPDQMTILNLLTQWKPAE